MADMLSTALGEALFASAVSTTFLKVLEMKGLVERSLIAHLVDENIRILETRHAGVEGLDRAALDHALARLEALLRSYS